MESNIILNAKTRNIMVSNVPTGTAQTHSQATGTVTIVSEIPSYIQTFIDKHNLDPHAHKRLWYVHEQAIASDIWEVEHNLDRNPSVTVVDTADNVVVGYITYNDKNNITIKFNGAFKGKAYLN